MLSEMVALPLTQSPPQKLDAFVVLFATWVVQFLPSSHQVNPTEHDRFHTLSLMYRPQFKAECSTDSDSLVDGISIFFAAQASLSLKHVVVSAKVTYCR